MTKYINYGVYKEYLDLLVERLRKQLEAEEILACALFGSVARGQAGLDSDIDLLVVTKSIEADTTINFVRLHKELKREAPTLALNKKGIFPEPYPIFLSAAQLQDNALILLDIADHGISLYDTGILERRLDQLRCRLRKLDARKVTHADGSWHWDLKPDWRPGEVIEL